jgi:hypothetical protein
MEATREGSIRVSGSWLRRAIALSMGVLVVAVLLSALVVWRIGIERSPRDVRTPAAVSEIQVDPPYAGAHRSTALPKRGEAEFPTVGPHPPGRQPKIG